MAQNYCPDLLSANISSWLMAWFMLNPNSNPHPWWAHLKIIRFCCINSHLWSSPTCGSIPRCFGESCPQRHGQPSGPDEAGPRRTAPRQCVAIGVPLAMGRPGLGIGAKGRTWGPAGWHPMAFTIFYILSHGAMTWMIWDTYHFRKASNGYCLMDGWIGGLVDWINWPDK